ncbi:hypothetical protein Cgig2_023256 [Carnegiea gigantea]|uniref:Uncharacterized protein n=1 Tax=Carnegiea gigantea TaxID=171969 RepID=A0A9Q1GVZ5_9CARY|nr:hypothetical protein Cgig2_023256 [Carnegiea gigantea]
MATCGRSHMSRPQNQRAVRREVREGRMERGSEENEQISHKREENVNLDLPQLKQEIQDKLTKGLVKCMICYNARHNPALDLYLTLHSYGEPGGKPLEKEASGTGISRKDFFPSCLWLAMSPSKLERKRIVADAFDISLPSLDALHYDENPTVSDMLAEFTTIASALNDNSCKKVIVEKSNWVEDSWGDEELSVVPSDVRLLSFKGHRGLITTIVAKKTTCPGKGIKKWGFKHEPLARVGALLLRTTKNSQTTGKKLMTKQNSEQHHTQNSNTYKDRTQNNPYFLFLVPSPSNLAIHHFHDLNPIQNSILLQSSTQRRWTDTNLNRSRMVHAHNEINIVGRCKRMECKR